MGTELLQYLGRFTYQENRKETARKLAGLLRSEDLIIFIKDRELNVLLPGLGFLQSLPNGKLWKQFLDSNMEMVFKGTVPYKNRMYPALAVRGINDAVAVLIGGTPGNKEADLLEKILAITAPLLIQEQLVMVAESKARHHAKLAEKSERLTLTLDSVQRNLMKVLEENSYLLQKTKEQNEELATANEELAAANEELTAANEEVLTNLEELNETQKRLMSINSDLENFIYAASHDLKSPISNIEGLMRMLISKLQNKGWIDGNITKITDMISVSINRFKDTINDLTEVAKIGKDTTSTPLNLVEIIDDVIADLHINIHESQAMISLQIQGPTLFLFSRKNMKSIIYNLISNAIKYRDPARKPLITIGWKEREDFFELKVKDNGIGMDISDESKIFGLFKRLHNHVDGTGIGLYIVKKIIENTGGRIHVDSTPGEGSTFCICFKKR